MRSICMLIRRRGFTLRMLCSERLHGRTLGKGLGRGQSVRYSDSDQLESVVR